MIKSGWPWENHSRNFQESHINGKTWPLVTVITPSYNQRDFLEATIRSVLLQGYPNLEYMVIDGGSTDGSVDIIHRYANQLTYWVSEKDHGQSHAINKGLSLAQGEIIGWLNADDTYSQCAITSAVNIFSIKIKKSDTPRIIFISSDSHQTASAIDYDEFGTYYPYGVKKAINNYSYFKLLLNTIATEFSRKLKSGDKIDVSVNVICPGPVNTDIIREAPLLLRLILRLIFSIFFQPPAKAAKPVAYLSISDDFADKTNLYLHMFNMKKMDQKVYDQQEGKRLWKESEKVWKKIDPNAGKV